MPTSHGFVKRESLVPTQVFRLKAEGYKLSRKARIKRFKTFSVSTIFGSSIDEFSLGKKHD
jgi:hypothetical protein